MQNKVTFTVAALDRAACPPGESRLNIYDTRTPALAFTVRATGGKSFYLYRRVGGRPQRMRLGGWPGMTIEQARNRAAELNGEIAKGIDPRTNKRRGREEATVGELFTHYVEAHAKLHKRTWANDVAQFDRHLDAWRGRKLSSIKKTDVQALHARTGARHGPYAANRLLALTHTLFAKAADLGFDKANPAAGVTRFKEKQRERFLQADELPRFFAALNAEPNETVRDFFWLALLTGARRGNVQAMRWEEVSLPRRSWHIPETKNDQPLTVPLVPAALEVLGRRRAAAEAAGEVGPWVFPSWGKAGHLVEPKKAWAAILKRAGITDLRIHDLRRTLGSWQAAGGSSLHIIGKSLGHKNVATTQIYARLNIDPVRLSVGSATDAMLAAGGIVPPPAEAPAQAS